MLDQLDKIVPPGSVFQRNVSYKLEEKERCLYSCYYVHLPLLDISQKITMFGFCALIKIPVKQQPGLLSQYISTCLEVGEWKLCGYLRDTYVNLTMSQLAGQEAQALIDRFGFWRDLQGRGQEINPQRPVTPYLGITDFMILWYSSAFIVSL